MIFCHQIKISEKVWTKISVSEFLLVITGQQVFYNSKII